MWICPHCRTTYPTGAARVCRKDRAELVDAEAYAARLADPLLGRIVLDRYTIEERIGVGAMGTVYRATQRGLGRSVAVKVLRPDLSADADTVARFHREAHAMSLLAHPNTVRVFDVGETSDGHLLFAMELLEGELLGARIDQRGLLTVREAVLVTLQVLSSLAEAHSKGVVHRDLKPDNVFLATVPGRAEPVVKVLDFGIAKVVHGDRKIDQFETQAGTVFGTPRYMSPEQAQGKPLDARSDLYTVGVVLYQLLVGHAPYVDDDAVVVMAKHIRERPVPPRAAAPDRPIPTSLERVVLRALEKHAPRRFPSADAFARALEDSLPDVEAAARHHEAREPLRPFGWRGVLSRAPRSAVVASASMVATACVIATYLVLTARPGPGAPAGPIEASTRVDAASPGAPPAAPAIAGHAVAPQATSTERPTAPAPRAAERALPAPGERAGPARPRERSRARDDSEPAPTEAVPASAEPYERFE